MFKELVNERLMAAADEIFALFERTIVSYEEELTRSRDEKERYRHQLEAVYAQQMIDAEEERPPEPQREIATFNQDPPNIKVEEEEPQPLHVKEEEELWITQEGEEADLTEVQLIGVSVKTEDGEDKPSESSRLQLQADHLFAPLLHRNDTASHSPEDDDWDDAEEPLSSGTNNKHSKCSQKKTGKKHLSCSVCAKIFTKKGDFTRHIRTHTGEKPFSCSVCGDTFAQRSTLTRHMRTHTGEKPFCCSLCGERFAHKVNMLSHMKTHTREKPFSCSVCGAQFSRKMHVVSHMRTHTGEKPFSCSVCGDSFAQSSTLNRHMGTHAGCPS